MNIFTIDAENNVTAHASAEDTGAVPDAESFTTPAELAHVAAGGPAGRFVEVWNALPGVTPVSKFTDRKTAVARIWKAIQALAEAAPATRASAAQHKADVEPARRPGGSSLAGEAPRTTARHGPRHQQKSRHPRPASALPGRHARRDHGDDRLAGPLRPRVHFRQPWQEDEADHHIGEARGRRTGRLDLPLKFSYQSFRPPGLVRGGLRHSRVHIPQDQPHLPAPVRESEAQSLEIRVAGPDQRLDGGGLAVAALQLLPCTVPR